VEKVISHNPGERVPDLSGTVCRDVLAQFLREIPMIFYLFTYLPPWRFPVLGHSIFHVTTPGKFAIVTFLEADGGGL
jgi:hypothetical protein